MSYTAYTPLYELWYNELPELWEVHKISELFTERREKSGCFSK